jgi:23S rRNA (cytosine1962-C5)-methyltransferase
MLAPLAPACEILAGLHSFILRGFRMGTVILKRQREKSLLRRHPWVFSGAIQRLDGRPRAGETVEVRAFDGRFLARGAFSPQSQISVRIWSFDPAREIDAMFFRERLSRALSLRRSLLAAGERTACRLVNAESDGLPGLVVDRYADVLVCQFMAAGVERWKREIVSQLAQLHRCATIYERSEGDSRAKEGLMPAGGVLEGAEPPDLVEIEEGTARFLVDVRRGHKTGFYLDQRRNRACVAAYAAGAEMLNCFAYTGGFGILALKSGAERVVNVDTSSDALGLAARHAELNGLAASRLENVTGDGFKILRAYRQQGRFFDLIVLDPPKFAAAAGQIAGASRGYKDINLLAFQLLRPQGRLVTFSCSGHISPELFQKIIADAALDAGRRAQIVRRLMQADDHPVALEFPEGSYLKGLVCVAI